MPASIAAVPAAARRAPSKGEPIPGGKRTEKSLHDGSPAQPLGLLCTACSIGLTLLGGLPVSMMVGFVDQRCNHAVLQANGHGEWL